MPHARRFQHEILSVMTPVLRSPLASRCPIISPARPSRTTPNTAAVRSAVAVFATSAKMFLSSWSTSRIASG